MDSSSPPLEHLTVKCSVAPCGRRKIVLDVRRRGQAPTLHLSVKRSGARSVFVFRSTPLFPPVIRGDERGVSGTQTPRMLYSQNKRTLVAFERIGEGARSARRPSWPTRFPVRSSVPDCRSIMIPSQKTLLIWAWRRGMCRSFDGDGTRSYLSRMWHPPLPRLFPRLYGLPGASQRPPTASTQRLRSIPHLRLARLSHACAPAQTGVRTGRSKCARRVNQRIVRDDVRGRWNRNRRRSKACCRPCSCPRRGPGWGKGSLRGHWCILPDPQAGSPAPGVS